MSCGRSRIRFLGGMDKETFAVVGNLLTMPVSAGLKTEVYTLIHMIESEEQHYNTPYKRYTRWKWILIRSLVDDHASFPSVLSMVSHIVSLRKVFLIHDTHSSLYDIIKISHFTWMYPECARGLSWSTILWRYPLRFHPGWLPLISLREIGKLS